MRTHLHVPLRTVLEWYDFWRRKPTHRGPCLFSDGAIFRMGWWSVSEGNLLIPNADGTNGIIDHEDIVCWAALPNMVSDVEEHFKF